jgi:hypothetical protein
MDHENNILCSFPVMVLIALFLCISTIPASAGTIVSIDDVYVEPGDDTSVPVMINNVTNLGVADIILTYNQSVVRVTSVTNSTFDFMTGVINDSAGTVRMCAMDYSDAGLSGDVKLADLVLEAAGSAGETSTLNLSINELKEAGTPETTIPAETDNGTFGIIDPPEPPTTLLNTTGCHWINWTWITGSNCDFVEVGIGGVWVENCTDQCYNCSYPPHATRTISLRGYNSCLDIYSYYVSQTTTIPNHAPVAIARSLHRHNNVGSIYPCNAIFNASASYDPDGSIANYRWNLGDGTTGTGALIEHIYPSCNWNGTGYDPFIVSLTVIDDLDPLINDAVTIPVNVYIAGDANGDGEVDIFDATTVGLEWSKTCEGDTWTDQSDKADLNNDCEVDIFDAVIIGANWEHTAH